MKKLIGFTLAAFLLSASAASAASISGLGTAIFSGQTNLYGNAGQNVQVSTNFDAASGEVLHAIQTDFAGDFVGPVCHVVGIVEGAQTNVSEAFTELLPPNANDYGFTMKAFTAVTVPQANALNQNQGTACTGTNTSVYNQSNVVHVLPNGSGSPPPPGGTADSEQLARLLVLIDTLQKQIAALQATASSTPAPTAACVTLVGYNAFSYGDRGTGVRTAQEYVMSHDGSISAGATGFWGNQSANALIQAKGANHCV